MLLMIELLTISAVYSSHLYVRARCDPSTIQLASRDSLVYTQSPEKCSSMCTLVDSCDTWAIINGTCTSIESLFLRSVADEDYNAGTDVFTREQNYPFGNDGNKLLLQFRTNVSILSIGQGSTCTQPPPLYPSPVQATNGAVVNGRVTICGGSYTSLCYHLDQNSNQWQPFPSLPEPRGYAKGVVTAWGWWISGGNSSGNEVLSTSVLFNSSSLVWMPGSDLPTARQHHCVTQISRDETFVAGGFDGTNAEGVQVPTAGIQRYGMACAPFLDSAGSRNVVVAGGKCNYCSLVQIFSLVSQSWSQAANLPGNSYYGTFYRSSQGLLLINPYYDNVYSFFPSNYTFKAVAGLGTGLTQQYYTTVVPVADSVLYEC